MSLDWSLAYSASCPHIAGHGLTCILDDCAMPATGHCVVVGGVHDGRCLAVLCVLHATEAGNDEFRAQLVEWMLDGLLARDGGPGPNGAPEVVHGDHRDPLPSSEHGVGW